MDNERLLRRVSPIATDSLDTLLFRGRPLMNAPRHNPNAPLRQRPVLVTGGTGFIGVHVVQHLLRCQCETRILDTGDQPAGLPDEAQYIQADIRDFDAVRDAVRGCGTVLHLAGNPNLWSPAPEEYEQVNHLGTRQVLEASVQANVSRVIHVSTELILEKHTQHHLLEPGGLPDARQVIGPYCQSKLRAEQAVRDYAARGLWVSIVSPGVPLGAHDDRRGPLTRMIDDFLHQRLKAYLDTTFHLVDVRDVAATIVAAADHGEPARRYVSVAESWPMRRLLEALADITKLPAPTVRVPYVAAITFAWLEEQVCRLTGGTPMAGVDGVRLTRRTPIAHTTAPMRELGVTVSPCRTALQQTVDWLRTPQAQAVRADWSPQWRPTP